MRKKQDHHKTIIIGAGAAGLFCAWLLAKSGQPFLLLEQGGQAGRKLAISGGGHANFTNAHLASSRYLGSGQNNFCEYALGQFDSNQLLKIINSLNLHYQIKNDGQFFLREKASLFRDRLLAPVMANLCTNVRALSILREGNAFKIFCPQKIFSCEHLILAPGSPARPELALCSDCWEILRNFDVPLIPLKPALAPLLFPEDKYRNFAALSGLSVNVEASLSNQPNAPVFKDSMLFTHFGLSGPAILNSSLYFNENSTLLINFMPGENFEKMCDSEGAKTPSGILKNFLPSKLAEQLLPPELQKRKCAELSRKQRQLLGRLVHASAFENLKAAGLAKAEVCAGGVNTGALNPQTMQLLKMPNLHIIGEAQNITGQLGGYNLHWAFASAWCAATSLYPKHF